MNTFLHNHYISKGNISEENKKTLVEKHLKELLKSSQFIFSICVHYWPMAGFSRVIWLIKSDYKNFYKF